MTTTDPAHAESVGVFADTVFEDLLGGQKLFALYLGDRLGWYRTLVKHGPMTAVELAKRTSTDSRYARATVVDGFDVDEDSVAAATANAAAYGVSERVRFHCTDVGILETDGEYDAAFAFECVHDLPDPVTFLGALRRISRPGAPVVVMDERTESSFTPGAGPVEQLLYGFSILCCLPDGMSDPDSVGTGTVMRPHTLESYSRSAGFTGATILDIDHEIFRFYCLQ